MHAKNIQFKPINFDELDLCVQFRLDTFKISFPDSNKWQALWDEEAYGTWLIQHAKNFPLGAVHIWRDGAIIGQLEFGYGDASNHVNLFYLKAQYRGKGLSQTLHDYVTSTLKKAGTQNATLRACPTNLPAVGFYLKNGWQDCGADEKQPEVNGYRLTL